MWEFITHSDYITRSPPTHTPDYPGVHSWRQDLTALLSLSLDRGENTVVVVFAVVVVGEVAVVTGAVSSLVSAVVVNM